MNGRRSHAVTAAATPVDTQDLETRDRLLREAAQLFATHGFGNVTVRDICQQAHANVAAINYHFGGKAGLYADVIDVAIRTMQATTEEIRKAGEGRPPDQQLEAAIRVFLTRVAASKDKWIHQLMLREVANPTAAFDAILKRVLEPRMAYMRGAIAGIMRCPVSDRRVALCMMSVQAQLHALLNSPLAERLAAPRLTAADADRLARHIACFSIAGVRAIATS